jgi:hypothetical protein
LCEAGCIHPKTYIAQGQVLTTGNATYDGFFRSVRDLHAEAERSSTDERASRGALITALGLEPKTTPQMALGEAGERAKKIREAGILIHVELVPTQRVITKKERRDATLSPQGKEFLKAVEDSTRSSLALSARVGGIATRAAQLEKVRTELRAQVPVAFRGEVDSRRDEIVEELDAAAAVLTDAADMANRSSGLAAKFAFDLAHALDTGGAGGAEDDDAKSATARSQGAPTTARSQSATTTARSQGATTTSSATAATPPSPSASAEPEAQPIAKKPPPTLGSPRRSRRAQPAAPAAKPPPSAAAKKPKGNDDFEP